jgi:hypothetical protein
MAIINTKMKKNSKIKFQPHTKIVRLVWQCEQCFSTFENWRHKRDINIIVFNFKENSNKIISEAIIDDTRVESCDTQMVEKF